MAATLLYVYYDHIGVCVQVTTIHPYKQSLIHLIGSVKVEAKSTKIKSPETGEQKEDKMLSTSKSEPLDGQLDRIKTILKSIN